MKLISLILLMSFVGCNKLDKISGSLDESIESLERSNKRLDLILLRSDMYKCITPFEIQKRLDCVNDAFTKKIKEIDDEKL